MAGNEGIRERLIAVGVSAIQARGARPLPDVQPAEVAQLAGVPKGALYQNWDSFDDYRRDLLLELLRSSSLPGGDLLVACCIDSIEEGVGHARLNHRAMGELFDMFMESSACRWIIAGYPHRDDDRIAEAIAALLAECALHIEQPVRLLLALQGRVMRPKLTLAQLSKLLVSLFLGLAVRGQVEGAAANRMVPWKNGELVPLVGLAAEGLLLGASIEAEGANP